MLSNIPQGFTSTEIDSIKDTIQMINDPKHLGLGDEYGYYLVQDTPLLVRLIRSQNTRIAELEAQVANLNDQMVAADFWANTAFPEGATAEQIQAELADYHMIMNEVSEVYDSITVGKFSKINTAAEHIIGEVEEITNKIVAEAVEEAVKPLQAQVDRLMKLADEWEARGEYELPPEDADDYDESSGHSLICCAEQLRECLKT